MLAIFAIIFAKIKQILGYDIPKAPSRRKADNSLKDRPSL